MIAKFTNPATAAMETSATTAGEFIRWTTTTSPMAGTHWPTVTRGTRVSTRARLAPSGPELAQTQNVIR